MSTEYALDMDYDSGTFLVRNKRDLEEHGLVIDDNDVILVE